MVEGMWTGEFKTNVSNITHGVGVFVFRNGKIYGGNALFYFLGSYESEQNQVMGELLLTHYAGDPLTIFGLIEPHSSFRSRFHGELLDNRIRLRVEVEGMPTLRIDGVLTKRANSDIF